MDKTTVKESPHSRKFLSRELSIQSNADLEVVDLDPSTTLKKRNATQRNIMSAYVRKKPSKRSSG